MKICLVTDRTNHPTLNALTAILRTRHQVTILNPDLPQGWEGQDTDLVLLKAHTTSAMAVGRGAERHGARVVNAVDATIRCRDRVLMAERAAAADLPFPVTAAVARLADCQADVAALGFPLVVKSRHSRRGDLVAPVRSEADLLRLVHDWPHEPVVVQRLMPNDGWDHKLWVAGPGVFYGLRRTQLDTQNDSSTLPIDPTELPASWRALTDRVAAAFDLEVFGIDVVVSQDGPLIVDINAFPGFRGVAGAAEAIAALADDGRLPTVAVGPAGADRGLPRGGDSEPGKVPVAELHAAARALAAHALGGPVGLRPRYVRRKPGRGVVVTYRPVVLRHGLEPTSRRLQAVGEGNLQAVGEGMVEAVTLQVSEETLGDPTLPMVLARAPLGAIAGLSVEQFPSDSDLASLAVALDASEGSPTRAVLLRGAHQVLGRDPVRVDPIRVTTVRYKPGTRCVLRYALTLGRPTEDGTDRVVLYGKLYRDRPHAVVSQRLAAHLWGDADNVGLPRPPLPRPLGVVEELGLALTEVAGGAHGAVLQTGTAVLTPRRRGLADDPAVRVPGAGLHESAVALAWLHGRGRIALGKRRTLSVEAAAMLRRAAELTDSPTALATDVHRLADDLAATMCAGPDVADSLVHGAYKPSQLLFGEDGRAYMTDFDGAGIGDPALDVGCFLAYLRPPAYWRGTVGSRAWSVQARRIFLEGYAAARSGGRPPDCSEMLRRSLLFEAALLFKIATRRIHRLQSPRPAETARILGEARSLLDIYRSSDRVAL